MECGRYLADEIMPLSSSDLTSNFLRRVGDDDDFAGHILSSVVDSLGVVEDNVKLLQAHFSHCYPKVQRAVIPRAKIESSAA